MIETNTNFNYLIITTSLVLLAIAFFPKEEKVEEPKQVEVEVVDTLKVDTLQLTKENFFKACEYYDIKFPEIVWAQARLESGNFKSNVYKTKNNFLGLTNAKIRDYYTFSHWTDCLRGYKNSVQYKYKGDDTTQSYYTWLRDLPYAEDPHYISKVKRIAGDS